MNEFEIYGIKSYKIEKTERIKTPALLVFHESVLKNLQLMKSYLEQIAPDSGYKHLCPHIKTNKSAFITKMMLKSGISFFKCTPNEVEMLVLAGAKEIFVAYPVLEQDARELAKKIKTYPDINFYIQIGTIDHAKILNQVALQEKVLWNYFIDIDVGMHRTGSQANSVFELIGQIKKSKYFKFIGLHGYDGHNHYKDKKLRIETSQKSMSVLINLYRQLVRQNIYVAKIVVAGSPSFRIDLEILYKKLKNDVELFVSPGTWIYWDSQYNNILPGEFEFAALILAQVMDIGKNQIILNLGHKRWAADQGKIQIFSQPDLKVKSFSEEHTVLSPGGISDYHIGDYILIVPRHICPTVNLYENFVLIGSNGQIEDLAIPIDARNR